MLWEVVLEEASRWVPAQFLWVLSLKLWLFSNGLSSSGRQPKITTITHKIFVVYLISLTNNSKGGTLTFLISSFFRSINIQNLKLDFSVFKSLIASYSVFHLDLNGVMLNLVSHILHIWSNSKTYEGYFRNPLRVWICINTSYVPLVIWVSIFSLLDDLWSFLIYSLFPLQSVFAQQ